MNGGVEGFEEAEGVEGPERSLGVGDMRSDTVNIEVKCRF